MLRVRPANQRRNLSTGQPSRNAMRRGAQMTRAEHIRWCKERALAYLPDTAQASAAFASDINKHDETAKAFAGMGGLLLRAALTGPDELKRFIEGFAE